MAAAGLGVDLTLKYAQFTEGINKAAGSLKSLEGVAKTAGAAIGGYLSIGMAKQFMEMGAKALQAEDAFRHAAASMKVDADKWVQSLKQASNATVDTSDMMQQAMKSVTGGLSQSDTIKLMEISRLEARRMGVDVVEAYSSISDAVETGKTKMLNRYNLLTKAQQELIDKAKSAGVEVNTLTFIVGNYERHAQMMGELTENASEKFQQNKAIVKDLSEEIGIGLVNALAEAIKGFKDLATFGPFRRAHEAALYGESAVKSMTTNIPMPRGEFGEKSPTNEEYEKYIQKQIDEADARKKAEDAAQKQAEAIQKVLDALKFEEQQLTRTKFEQDAYNKVKGLSIDINSTIAQSIIEEARRIQQLSDFRKYDRQVAEQVADEMLQQIEDMENSAKEAAESESQWMKTKIDLEQRWIGFLIKEDEVRRSIGVNIAKQKAAEQVSFGIMNKGQGYTAGYGIDMGEMEKRKAALMGRFGTESESGYMAPNQDAMESMISLQTEINRLSAEYLANMESYDTTLSIWSQEHQAMATFAEAWGVTQKELITGTQDTAAELGAIWADVSRQIGSTITTSIIDLIKGTFDAKKAVESLATSILSTLLNALIKIGVQQVVLASVGQSMLLTQSTATALAMAKIAASAGTAASMMSMATWGSSATIGASVYAGMLGMTMGLNAAAIAAGLSSQGMAEGGVINEHIIGRGQSGQIYEFGEKGPERVTPMNRGRGASNITININGNVLNSHDELARILVPAIRKANYDGVY